MSLLNALLLVAGTASTGAPADVSCASLLAGASTVERVPGAHYAAGGLHKFFLGSTNRRYWTAPIEVPVLDLQSFAGGLTAKERTGSQQSRGVKLVAGDGRSFRVRGVDKNNELLQGTPFSGIVRDQTSAHHPAGGVVVTPLSRAAGVPSVTRCFVVLPDDAALGEFRKEFAGMLGMIEEMPRAEPLTAGLPQVTQIVDTKELMPLLEASPAERVDSRAFLRARLFDIWLSDWDRHHEQWEWGKGSDGRWLPIPKDRDRVFENHNGLLIGMARLGVPHLMDFTPEYRKLYAYISNSRDQDRRLLADLDLAAWNEVAAELRASLSDGAIEQGVAELPGGLQQVDAGRLAGILKARRDGLPRLAGDLYRLISDKVDIHATGAHEIAEIQRDPDGQVEVRLATLEDRSTPYFRRRFLPDETGEIRIYLNDGNDRVSAIGAGSQGPTVRIIGGNGNDILEGPREKIHFYESDEGRPREQKLDENGNHPLDWGSSVSLFPSADIETDIGLILGAGVNFKKYGFRAQPFRSRQTLTAETATNTGWRFGYEGEWHRTGSDNYSLLNARYSEIESLRFYGFGNETTLVAPTEFYRVDQRQYLLAPAYVVPHGAATFSFGPVAKYSNTDMTLERFIASRRPYGSDEFGQVGAQAGMDLDTREPRKAPRKGVRLRAGGSLYPAVWSVQETFGDLHGDAAVHVPIPVPLRPSLGFRVGAKKLFGLYPFHEAAYLGGTRTVRGISRNRFAGDAYAFGNAELRLRLFKFLGVFGLADAGRVFLATETSDHWHTAAGGGLWLSFKDDKYVVSVTSARSEGHNSFYVKSGLAF